MENVAVIDIGSARTKFTIAKFVNGKYEFIRLKDETKLSSKINSSNEIDLDFISQNLIPLLDDYRKKAVENKCRRILTVGTHVLREAKNAKLVQDMINNVLGKLNIIPSETEGAIFFSWMKSQLHVSDICVVDIGGGSVQICQGDEKVEVRSIPTGTFTLEAKFQQSKDTCTVKELSLMAHYVKTCLVEKNISKHKSKILVMGSNCMKDFVDSALENANLNPVKLEIDRLSCEKIDTLKDLLNQLVGKNYSDLGNYYPQNKMFMYGADKALINLLEVSAFLKVNAVLPTNESLSTALIGMLSQDPEELKRHNILYHDL